MSQTTTSIFASPGNVLPNANSFANAGRTSAAVPKLAIPKLVVCDAAGKILQSWDLRLPKGTLGSAESCTICCPLPGIAPIHALLVSGARQAFVRSLAGKLTQDGLPASELLLSDDKCYFEIAGFRFNLLRADVKAVADERKKTKRMQFALARPFSISSATKLPAEQAEPAKSIDAPWVANVIREAIEPLEAQIDSLLLPLAEFQSQSLQAQLASARSEEEQRARTESERKVREQEIVGMVALQSATMDTLTERIGDVNQQLHTIERIIAQDAEANAASTSETAKVIAVQQSAIEQLQTGMVSVSDSLKQLQERQKEAQRENSTWKNEVQLQLQQLTSAVTEFSSIAEGTDQTALVDAIESLKQTHEVAQLEIGRWQSGVQQQLHHLQETLRDSEGKAQAEIPVVIAEALSEIQAKHDQSLQELQSWKSELKLEMQQLFQSASAAAMQSALEAQAQAEQVRQSLAALVTQQARSVESQPQVDILSAIPVAAANQSAVNQSPVNHSPVNHSPASFTNVVATELSPTDFGSAPISSADVGSSRFIAHELSSQFDEPVHQEVVDEELISQFQPQTTNGSQGSFDQGSFENNSHYNNDFASGLDPSNTALSAAQPENSTENHWPTFLLDNQSQNLEAHFPATQLTDPTQFSDQWSMQSNSGVLENDSINSEPYQWIQEPHSSEDPLSESNNAFAQSNLSMPSVEDSADYRASFQSSGFGEPSATDLEPKFLEAYTGSTDQESIAATAGFELSSPTSAQAQEEEVVSNRQPALPSWWTAEDDNEILDRKESTHSSENWLAPESGSYSASLPESLKSPTQITPPSQETSEIQAPVAVNDLPPSLSQSSTKISEPVQDQRAMLQSPVNAPSAFDLNHLYEELDNHSRPQPAGSQNASALSSGQQQAGLQKQIAEEEEFIGFGLEESHARIEQPKPSAVMSIDQLAHLEDDDNESENLFLFSPQKQPEQPQNNSVSPVDAPSLADTTEDDSVEAYMKNLLARMRGETVEEPQTQSKPSVAAPVSNSHTPSSPAQLNRERQVAEAAANSMEPVKPFDFENYVPFASAPEKGKNISALRDLANTTARTAIHKSTRNRTLSGSLMKFAIAAIALTVAATLFAINGLAINVALIATVAALLVALIWGYDGLKSLKPLLQNSLVLQPNNNVNSQSDDEVNQ